MNYLEKGKLHVKNEIKVLSLNYNDKGDHHHGVRYGGSLACVCTLWGPYKCLIVTVSYFPVHRDFVYWYVPQIQFKNPNLQIISLKNITPTPFFRAFYGKSRY